MKQKFRVREIREVELECDPEVLDPILFGREILEGCLKPEGSRVFGPYYETATDLLGGRLRFFRKVRRDG